MYYLLSKHPRKVAKLDLAALRCVKHSKLPFVFEREVKHVGHPFLGFNQVTRGLPGREYQGMSCWYLDTHVMRKELWDRQGQTLRITRRKCIAKRTGVPTYQKEKKKPFRGQINAFSPLFYRKWTWVDTWKMKVFV